jgi:hypothetical protein
MIVPHNINVIGPEAHEPRRNRTAARTPRPSAGARLAARLHAGSLDRALIAGADPAESHALAARAAVLTSPRTRAHIAEGLERALAAAQGPQRRWWAVSPHSPLAANAGELKGLAELLRADVPVYASGVAMLGQLLADGAGPAYRGQPQALARRLREARAAMVGWTGLADDGRTSVHRRQRAARTPTHVRTAGLSRQPAPVDNAAA